MKILVALLFLLFGLTAVAQVQPVGTVIGNQTVISVPISPYANAQALIYYPDDYFLPENANKKYALFVFLHGAGEGSSNNIRQVTNTSLPQLIAQGLKPAGIDSTTGETIKFIVISPHAANTNYSYSGSNVQYPIMDAIAKYRVDSTRVFVGGLSAGGRGAWSMVKTFRQAPYAPLTGIVPISALGYEFGTDGQFQWAIASGRAIMAVCGQLDAHVTTQRALVAQALNYDNPPPQRIWSYEVPGADHNSSAWNPIFQLNNRWLNPTKNLWDLMASIKTGAAVPGNPPPVNITANAGQNQTITLPTNQVTLSGSGSPAGSITGYAWTKLSGGAATITSPSSASTTVTGMVAGTYSFRLTVTGSNGATANSTVQITVNPATANTPPVANAGAAQNITLPTSQVTLSGSGSDANGTVTGYVWTKISGGSATINSSSTASTLVTGLSQGTYSFQLTVTDNQGATGSSTVQVTVNAAGIAPVANAGPDKTITLPTNSVSVGVGYTYQWTKIAGPTQYSISNAAVSNPVINGLVAGTYTFRLTVTNSAGATSYDDVNIIVTGASNAKTIAGRIEAESYNRMNGVQTENTGDAGGGVNVGWIDNGDWMDYDVYVASAGTYTVNFRIATPNTGAQLQLRKSDGSILTNVTITPTGGYQNWNTISSTVTLPAGNQTIRLYSANAAIWNINWMDFIQTAGRGSSEGTIEENNTATNPSTAVSNNNTVSKTIVIPQDTTTNYSTVRLYPNPVSDNYTVEINNAETGKMSIQLVDQAGSLKQAYNYVKDQQLTRINLSTGSLASGTYMLIIQVGKWRETKKLIKL